MIDWFFAGLGAGARLCGVTWLSISWFFCACNRCLWVAPGFMCLLVGLLYVSLFSVCLGG